MAIEVPKEPKIYTTKYENFKGVDFTNDATNVWYRRSPSGLNMLPDASGRPFKRKGWEILLSNDDICTYLGITSCSIQKCAYFEIGGVDHIAIFTDCGVAFYNGTFTDKCLDYDCYSGFDRCFFFEGNGVSAFYIYGNYKVWRYESDFALHDVTSELTIPTLLISADATGAGTMLQGYNLLNSLASIEYTDTSLFTWWASDGLQVYVKDDWKTGKTINSPAVYRYKWSGSAWTDVLNTGVAFDSTNITFSGTPQANDEIILVYAYGVMLPNNVAQAQIATDVSVYASVSMQFDYEMEVIDKTETLATGKCILWDDDTNNRENGRAMVLFDTADVGDINNPKIVNPIVSGEDFLKVIFPTVTMVKSAFQLVQDTGTATLVEVM